MTTKQWITTGLIVVAAFGIAAASAPKANTISGRIEAINVPTPTTVFLIARAETGNGHPLLAKKLEVKQFPVNFTIGPDDAMMTTALPPRVNLEARVDRDGDAATHEPGAPSATVSGVPLGATDVVLRLQ